MEAQKAAVFKKLYSYISQRQIVSETSSIWPFFLKETEFLISGVGGFSLKNNLLIKQGRLIENPGKLVKVSEPGISENYPLSPAFHFPT